MTSWKRSNSAAGSRRPTSDRRRWLISKPFRRSGVTTKIVATVARMTDPLAVPARPEHHYRYDPGKATSYPSSTLAWVGDPAAVDYAREVIHNLAPGDSTEVGHGGWQWPASTSRSRLFASASWTRRSPLPGRPSRRAALHPLTSRAREVIDLAELAGASDVVSLRDTYRELIDGFHE